MMGGLTAKNSVGPWGAISGQHVARARPEFGKSVDPIQTRGADFAPHTTANPPDSKSYLRLWPGLRPEVFSFYDLGFESS